MTLGKCIQADAGQGWAGSNASWALDGQICKHWPLGVGNITSQARSCWGREGDRGQVGEETTQPRESGKTPPPPASSRAPMS